MQIRETCDSITVMWLTLCLYGRKTSDMNDIDFIRITSMLILPKCLETSANPVKTAVDYAEELLRECQERENL